jgi:hypothetical protein
MSRPKPDKFASKLQGCFPVKGCLQRNQSKAARRLAGQTIASEPLSPDTIVDSRMEHTKQWLQNLSTVVNYDATLLNSPGSLSDMTCKADGSYLGWNDSPDSADRTLREGCGHGDCCCKRTDADNGCGGASSCSDVQKFRCPNNSSMLSDVNGALDDSSVSKAKAKLSDSTFLSASSIANSSMLSSRCCSQHHRHRSHHRSSSGVHQNQPVNDCSSIASSSVSLTTELVTINLDEGRPLGITIVGHSSGQHGGDCGIFVGCVKRGGAAAADGRIEPGDLILEVNGIDLEGRTNEQALQILRSELARGGTVRILVAKYWDMENEDDCRREPIYEPVGSVRSSTLGVVRGTERSTRPGPLKAIPEDSTRPRMYREASGASASDSERGSSHRVSSVPPPSSRSQLPPIPAYPPMSQPSRGAHQVSRSQSASRNTTLDRHHIQKTVNPVSADEPFLGGELIAWIRSQVPALKSSHDALSYANDLLQSGFIYTVNRPHQPQNGTNVARFQFREDEYYVFGRTWDGQVPRIGGASGAYL